MNNLNHKTAIHILDIIRKEPASPERDKSIIFESTLIINQIRIWAAHLQACLQEKSYTLNQFGKDPVQTCEDGFLETQCIAIGALSR